MRVEHESHLLGDARAPEAGYLARGATPEVGGFYGLERPRITVERAE